MNDGMPGMNTQRYTDATGHPANRNCSSGWTKRQRAPINSHQFCAAILAFTSFDQYCYSPSRREQKEFCDRARSKTLQPHALF
jgi:hypothetical protein